jgi:hypothetical protein
MKLFIIRVKRELKRVYRNGCEVSLVCIIFFKKERKRKKTEAKYPKSTRSGKNVRVWFQASWGV